MLHGYDFTHPMTLVRSGLALGDEIEIEGTARFYLTGDGPQIERIDLYGVPVDVPPRTDGKPHKPVYRELAPSDLLWQQIAAWLVDERGQAMADSARADAWAAKGRAA